MPAENLQPKKIRVPEPEILNSVGISPYLKLDISGESAREVVTKIQEIPQLLTNLMYITLVQHWTKVNEVGNPLFTVETSTTKPSFSPFGGVEQNEIGVVHELPAEPREEEIPGSDAVTNFASAFASFAIQKSPQPSALVFKAREYIRTAIPDAVPETEILHLQLSSPDDVTLLEEKINSLMHDFRTPVMEVTGGSDLLSLQGILSEEEILYEKERLKELFTGLTLIANGANETLARRYIEVPTTTKDIIKTTHDLISKEASITFLEDPSLEALKDFSFIWNRSLQTRTIQNIVNNTYDQLRKTINRTDKKSLDDLREGRVSEPQSDAGNIVVSARFSQENDYLELCFTDNAGGRLPQPTVRRGDAEKRKEYSKLLMLRGGQGIGLQGIREELQQFFGADLYLEQAENGIRTVLRFPLLQIN